MGKKGKRRGYQIPSPEEDERVGKLFVLCKQEWSDGNTLDVITPKGTYSRYFPDDTVFLFLGVGRSTGRRFKGGYFKRGGSQRVHKFLVNEELVEATLFHHDFNKTFARHKE